MTPLTYGILWNRLIAVVEEQAQTMIRTAFSTTVRESGDLSAGVFDLQGRMLAQAVTGTPGHVNSMMESVGHFLRRFPAATMQPGDHYITNDPWLGTGHLHDPDGGVPRLPRRPHGRAVRQHRPRDRRRRPRHGAGSAVGVRGGPLHPDREVLRPGRRQRDLLRHPARRHPPAGGAGGGRLLAVRLQRRGDPAAGRDDDRVRHGRAGRPRRTHLRRQPPRDRGRHRRPAARHLPRRDRQRRLRGAAHPQGHDDGGGRRDHRRFHRHLRPVDARDQRAGRLHPGLHRVRTQGRGGAGHPEQHRLARAIPLRHPRGLHPERPPGPIRSRSAT